MKCSAVLSLLAVSMIGQLSFAQNSPALLVVPSKATMLVGDTHRSLLARSATSQSASIHQQIQQTYNFQPHLLSNQQITEKSAALDQLWKKAKKERSHYIPTLRQELSDFKNPIFFFYDGSMLRLSLSDTPADRKIALAAMETPNCGRTHVGLVAGILPFGAFPQLEI
jgi:hypothetical protein